MEKPILSMPVESEASQVKDQEHAGDLISLRALFIRNFFLQAKQLTSINTGKVCNV
jgi:hypothetical protein